MSSTLKDLGNKAFANRDYSTAIDYYTQAIEFDGTNAVLFSNRAMCYLKLEDYNKALQDCDEGLKNVTDDKAKVKLLFRKASSFKGMGSFKLARQYYQAVLQLDPKNEQALTELGGLDDQMEVESSRQEIPIKKVDTLPENYQRLLDGKSFDIEKKESVTLKTPENERLVDEEIEALFGDRKKPEPAPTVSFVERNSTSPLLLLKSLAGADVKKAYNFVINLPPQEIKDSFSYGVETDFFTFFIEAAIYVSTHESVNNWEQKILEILKGLSTVKRYEIAKSFVDLLEINKLKQILQTKTPSLYSQYETLL